MVRRSSRITALNESKDLETPSIPKKTGKRGRKPLQKKQEEQFSSDSETSDVSENEESNPVIDRRGIIQLQQFDVEVKSAIFELESCLETSLKELDTELQIQLKKIPPPIRKMKVKDLSKLRIRPRNVEKKEASNDLTTTSIPELKPTTNNATEDYIRQQLKMLQQMAAEKGMNLTNFNL